MWFFLISHFLKIQLYCLVQWLGGNSLIKEVKMGKLLLWCSLQQTVKNKVKSKQYNWESCKLFINSVTLSTPIISGLQMAGQIANTCIRQQWRLVSFRRTRVACEWSNRQCKPYNYGAISPHTCTRILVYLYLNSHTHMGRESCKQ